eukprot:CAMPEP_0172478140 /NCGR_PEP_ID=MMETSP1066-20121228/1933_1 /TAXON_ID=671091 /ORGANISM="Coscinodiscus wailesii, Strain CCMP2513" /LENGTH=834 /DNA_ID=CAMNT_0013237445 /DNA_START=100 /DNA_END=2601 /DNA_ORIENTATION=-
MAFLVLTLLSTLVSVTLAKHRLRDGSSLQQQQQQQQEQYESPLKKFILGDTHRIFISSMDNKTDTEIKPSYQGSNCTYTLRHKDASYISLHFSQFEMSSSSNCLVRITDAEDVESSVLRGRGRQNQGSFWARHVLGDIVHVTFTCCEKNSTSFFEIDEYVSGFPLPPSPNDNISADLDNATGTTTPHISFPKPNDENIHHDRHLTICQSDDKRNARCYGTSAEYRHSKAVARLFINGIQGCTGFLVTSSLLMTNHHCIASVDDVLNTDFEFMGEEPTCGSTTGNCWMCDRGVIYDGVSLVYANSAMDMALVRLEGNPGDSYGYLELENRRPVVGELIYIPQHPSGRAKELAINDSFHDDGFCQVLKMSFSCTGSTISKDVYYTCDTEGGSSGSPVILRKNHRVIALHHCGGGCKGNKAVPVTAFYNDIASYLSVNPTRPPTRSPTRKPTHKPTSSPSKFPTSLPTTAPSLSCSGPSHALFRLHLQFDKYPEETSWELRHALQSNILFHGNDYDAAGLLRIEKCLLKDCYTLVIRDKHGDGICCSHGRGYYKSWYDTELVAEGGRFKKEDTISIGVCASSVPSFSVSPTNYPSMAPTDRPSGLPTKQPSGRPSSTTLPTFLPSRAPSLSIHPSLHASLSPTKTTIPSLSPTKKASNTPSLSFSPTTSPTIGPTVTTHPTYRPSPHPSDSVSPTDTPTIHPTENPSNAPSKSTNPSLYPSSHPTDKPSNTPTLSLSPTTSPTIGPTVTSQPSYIPSSSPSDSMSPTDIPTASPTANPSYTPSMSTYPSLHPSSSPTKKASNTPSLSVSPTTGPTIGPTVTSRPSYIPSSSPSESIS